MQYRLDTNVGIGVGLGPARIHSIISKSVGGQRIWLTVTTSTSIATWTYCDPWDKKSPYLEIPDKQAKKWMRVMRKYQQAQDEMVKAAMSPRIDP